jgi:type IV pilus biogenesis protein PilP
VVNKLIIGFIALSPCIAVAQSSYLDEMAKMDAQMAYLQKQADLKLALQRTSPSEALPKVISIVEDDKGLTAQLVYSSGLVRWVAKGDLLARGLSVSAITSNTVSIGGGRNRIDLQFVTPQVAGGAISSHSSVGMPLPPLPTFQMGVPALPAPAPTPNN